MDQSNQGSNYFCQKEIAFGYLDDICRLPSLLTARYYGPYVPYTDLNALADHAASGLVPADSRKDMAAQTAEKAGWDTMGRNGTKIKDFCPTPSDAGHFSFNSCKSPAEYGTKWELVGQIPS